MNSHRWIRLLGGCKKLCMFGLASTVLLLDQTATLPSLKAQQNPFEVQDDGAGRKTIRINPLKIFRPKADTGPGNPESSLPGKNVLQWSRRADGALNLKFESQNVWSSGKVSDPFLALALERFNPGLTATANPIGYQQYLVSAFDGDAVTIDRLIKDSPEYGAARDEFERRRVLSDPAIRNRIEAVVSEARVAKYYFHGVLVHGGFDRYSFEKGGYQPFSQYGRGGDQVTVRFPQDEAEALLKAQRARADATKAYYLKRPMTPRVGFRNGIDGVDSSVTSEELARAVGRDPVFYLQFEGPLSARVSPAVPNLLATASAVKAWLINYSADGRSIERVRELQVLDERPQFADQSQPSITGVDSATSSGGSRSSGGTLASGDGAVMKVPAGSGWSIRSDGVVNFSEYDQFVAPILHYRYPTLSPLFEKEPSVVPRFAFLRSLADPPDDSVVDQIIAEADGYQKLKNEFERRRFMQSPQVRGMVRDSIAAAHRPSQFFIGRAGKIPEYDFQEGGYRLVESFSGTPNGLVAVLDVGRAEAVARGIRPDFNRIPAQGSSFLDAVAPSLQKGRRMYCLYVEGEGVLPDVIPKRWVAGTSVHRVSVFLVEFDGVQRGDLWGSGYWFRVSSISELQLKGLAK